MTSHQKLLLCFEAYQGSFTVKKFENLTTSVRLLCRVPADKEAEWMELVENVLIAVGGTSGSAHACKKWLLQDGKLKYGWFLSVAHPKMPTLLKAIAKQFNVVLPADTAKKPVAAQKKPMAQAVRRAGQRPDLEETPLSSTYQTTFPNQKGKGVFVAPLED